MYRYFIELAYNGKPYHGWQIQPNAPTVQEELNNALSRLLGTSTPVTGCGRTDTGVNASFFVAHFDSEKTIEDPKQLRYKLNRMLSNEISIFRIFPVDSELHARFSAKSRTYKYYLNKNKDPFSFEFAYRPYPLPNIDMMNQACQILMEYNDFTSFSKLHTDVKTNICHITHASWEETEKQIIFTITADRFLRNMVRAIVGTMLMIGQGKISPLQLRDIIEQKDRGSAGISVPGSALFLYNITY